MGLGDKIKDTFNKVLQHGAENIIGWFKKPIVDYLKEQIAFSTVHTEGFHDKNLALKVEALKESWQNSPESPSDVGEDLLGLIGGKLAKAQFERLIGAGIGKGTPTSNQIFEEIASVHNANYVGALAGIIGACVPTTQLAIIAPAMQAQLDMSGATQISGMGYSMLLNSAIGPIIQQELNPLVAKTLPPPDLLCLQRHRGIITPASFEATMKLHGFNSARLNAYLEVSKYWPSAQDFVRFAVRDTYNAGVVAKYGYDDNYPTNMEADVEKAGVDPEWLKHYWRAHWELPSPRMGYEMLHRGEISEVELRELLRINDYAPGWINRMMAISYTPYTRVDARRMYAMGVLDDDQYIKAMKDIGYDDDKAAKMLEWAKLYVKKPEKDLTKANIITGFKLGLLDREKALEGLKNDGYDDTEADLLISIQERKQQLETIESRLKTLRYRYAKGVITDGELTDAIGALELTPTMQESERVKAQQLKDKTVKLPSKDDLKSFLQTGLIDEPTYRNKMELLGYSPADVDLYLGVLGAVTEEP